MRHLAQHVVLLLLRGYKRILSPMFPPACRYVPTCSEYATEAVERYGVVQGSLMGVWRLLRCHPFAHGGYDPVVKDGRNVRDGAWKSGGSAPRQSASLFSGFGPCEHLKRNS